MQFIAWILVKNGHTLKAETLFLIRSNKAHSSWIACAQQRACFNAAIF